MISERLRLPRAGRDRLLCEPPSKRVNERTAAKSCLLLAAGASKDGKPYLAT